MEQMNMRLDSSLSNEFDKSVELLNELKEKRRILQLKVNEQEKREQKHNSLLESTAQRRIELEVK
jgi:hypothetical protein